jgi:hypothetical protein
MGGPRLREAEPLIKEDIPLPVDLPAVALKKGQCQVSWLRGENDRFQAMGITVWAIGNGRIPPEAVIGLGGWYCEPGPDGWSYDLSFGSARRRTTFDTRIGQ